MRLGMKIDELVVGTCDFWWLVVGCMPQMIFQRLGMKIYVNLNTFKFNCDTFKLVFHPTKV